MKKSLTVGRYRVYRDRLGCWMVYTDRVYGYYVPSYLILCTLDKKEVRKFLRKWGKT